MKYTRLLVLVLAVLLLGSMVACGGGEQAGDSATEGETASVTQQPQASNVTQTVPEPTATPVPPTPTPQPTATPLPEPTPTLEPMEELGGMYKKVDEVVDSYRSKGLMSYTISGALTDNSEGTDTMNIEFSSAWTKADNIFGYNMSSTISGMKLMEENSDVNDVSEMTIIFIDDNSYMKLGDQWITMPRGEMSDAETYTFAVGDFVNNLEDLERVGSETVNGIKTTHYTFSNINDYDGFLSSIVESQVENPDDVAFEPGRSEIKGDIWIAKDGGYPVKVDLKTYTEMNVTIKAADGTEKTVPTTIETRTYNEIFDINEDIVIEPPEGAPQPDKVTIPGFESGDFPIPEQTVVESSFGGMINLVSQLGPDEVTSFYDETLANLGWEKSGDFAPTWSKGDASFSMMITPNDDGTTTILLMTVPTP